jgi:hypothetical protein
VTGTGPAARGFRDQARWQAGWCERLGSPFTALVCALLAERLPVDTAMGRKLDGWPGDAFADVLALRVAGGLHAAARGRAAPRLAALYPPAPLPPADTLWAEIAALLDTPELLGFVESAPQTNEVARSGVLVPGMLVASAATGLPLRLFELGASAGLNLVPDRYRVEAGGVVAGDMRSPVVLAPRWEGASPPGVPLYIRSRLGVDLSPLDVADPAATTRMLSYIWADQGARLARMEAAIAIARTDPPEILIGDAADFVEREVRTEPGCLTLVFHSIAFQYFAGPTQARIARRLEALGEAAHANAPLAWLRFETDDPHASEPPTLRLRLWPGEDRLLAHAHPHGNSVRWVG